jgi:hypothetical protein
MRFLLLTAVVLMAQTAMCPWLRQCQGGANRSWKTALAEPVARREPPTFDITNTKPNDQIKVTVEKDVAVFDVSCPSGIGQATIALKQGNWPASVVVRLRLRGLEGFSVSAEKVRLSANVGSSDGNPRHMHLNINGKEQKLSGDEIKVLDAAGKPIKGLPGKDGYFEISLPRAVLEGQPKSLKIEWVDFYR